MSMTPEDKLLSESVKILGDIVKAQQLKIRELELRLENNEKLTIALKDTLSKLVDMLCDSPGE